MIEKLAKLVDVKSIVTLGFTFAFIALAFKGDVPKDVVTIYTVIISFYFGTQTNKK